MSPFLRRVMERRLEEQMQAVKWDNQQVTCGECGKDYTPKVNSHPEFCFNCRHNQRRRLTHAESTGKDFAS